MDVDVISAVDRATERIPGSTDAENLERVGGITYTAADNAFAEKLQKKLMETLPPVSEASTVTPFRGFGVQSASTDMGAVSWRVPTVQLSPATWVPGTPAHSWQVVAAGGMDIGAKGMMVAAKTMMLTTMDLSPIRRTS